MRSKRIKRKNKIRYDVKVHLVNDGSSFRLRFWNRHTKKYIKSLEKRFQAKSITEAIRIRDIEQADERLVHYVERKNTDTDFVSYFQDLIASKRNERTRNIYTQSLNKFKEFGGSEVPFSTINKDFIEGYRRFLLRNNGKQNSANLHFGVFAHGLRSAEERGHIKHLFFKRIPQVQVVRDVLTKSELSLLINTPWKNRLKEAFLLESLTAIAYQELKTLKWGDVNTTDFLITIKRRKTGVIISNPINKEIVQMLGPIGDRASLVFPELTSLKTFNNNIKAFVKSSGIKKYITSHAGRASCIINLISGRGGIYAAKNFAGHTDLKTTLRYAQFSAEMKREAGNDLMSGIDFHQEETP